MPWTLAKLTTNIIRKTREENEGWTDQKTTLQEKQEKKTMRNTPPDEREEWTVSNDKASLPYHMPTLVTRLYDGVKKKINKSSKIIKPYH